MKSDQIQKGRAQTHSSLSSVLKVLHVFLYVENEGVYIYRSSTLQLCDTEARKIPPLVARLLRDSQ